MISSSGSGGAGGGGGGGGSSGKAWGKITTVNTTGSGPFFVNHYYTSTFPSTVSAADRLYYSTQNINAQIFDKPDPTNNSQVSLEYYIE